MTMGTSSILIPLMIAQVLHHSVADLGVLSSLVSLVGVIGSLIWGRFSDASHRRKPFIVMSFAGVSLGFAGIALAQSFTAVLLLNMILNFFWVANAAVSVLIVIENKEESVWEQKIGYLNQIGALGWVAGLVFGSLSLAVAGRFLGEQTAIRILFAILSLGAAVASLLAARFIPRTTPKFTRRRFRGMVLALGNFLVERGRFSPYHLYHRFNPRRLPSLLWGEGGLSKETKRFLVATLFAFIAIGFFAVPLPLLLAQRFGLSSSMVFGYFVVLNSGVVLAYPLASRRIKKSGNKAVQEVALAVRLVLFVVASIYLMVSRAVPPAWVLVPFFLAIGVTWSFFQLSGVALASRLAKPEYCGQALGLYNAVAGVGSILAGATSGFLTEYVGYGATFAVAAVLLTVSLLILHRLPAPAGSLAMESSQQPGGGRTILARDRVNASKPVASCSR
jgi:MFS family permease